MKPKPKPLRFEVFQGKRNQWYFRIRSSNGNIMAQSEGYKTRQAAVKAIKSIQSKASWSGIFSV